MSRAFTSSEACITLTAGQTLANADVYLPETFEWDTTLAAVYVSGNGVTIRNVTVRTYVEEFLDEWVAEDAHADTGTGIPWDLCGIRIAGDVKSLTLENVHVEGFGSSGITGSRADGVTFKRVSVTRCADGVYFGYDAGLAKRVKCDGVTVYDTWGGSVDLEVDADEDHYSVARPGYVIGGDGMAGYFDDFALNRLHFSGEMFTGFKIVRSKRGSVKHCHANQMFLQGTQGQTENLDLTTDGTTDVVLRDCDVRKEYAVGMVSSPGSASSGIQVSWNATDCFIADSTIDGTGGDGHGIQLSGDCEVDVRGCTITGFNDSAGQGAAYAINVNDGSSVNEDVLTVNTFTGQTNLILSN